MHEGIPPTQPNNQHHQRQIALKPANHSTTAQPFNHPGATGAAPVARHIRRLAHHALRPHLHGSHRAIAPRTSAVGRLGPRLGRRPWAQTVLLKYIKGEIIDRRSLSPYARQVAFFHRVRAGFFRTL